jgi:hypothetical protein
MTGTRAELFSLRGAGLGLCLAALCACAQPAQDDFRSEGGTSFDPTGIITGTVAYLGPPPHCEYDGDGDPTRVIGRVILTLFEYTNPAPPEGRASSAVNLLVINGSKLFTTEDCLPMGMTPDPLDTDQRVTRSVDFYWPQITLRSTPQPYQIRGFYDTDEDMNPFFNVKNLPTEGDIGGGAVIDILAPEKGFLPVNMPAFSEARDGFIRPNITVGLNQPVWTERPAFELNERHRFLSSDEHVPVVPQGLSFPIQANQSDTLDDTWALTCADGKTTPDCGLTIDLLRGDDEVVAAFSAADVQLDFDERKSAFYIDPVDVRTIVPGGPDVLVPDGVPDPHPVLGATTSLDIDWYQPMVILQRRAWVENYNPANPDSVAALAATAALEVAAGIPSVSMVGTPLPSQVDMGVLSMGGPGSERNTRRTVNDSIAIAVAPVGVVDLNPPTATPSSYNPFCRVPYIPYGTTTNPMSTQRTSVRSYATRYTTCQDVPTGFYAVNVLSGIAGGFLAPPAATPPVTTDNGLVASGPRRFSSQAWSLPNPLGDPAQIGAAALRSQGWDQLFVVHDPDPESHERRLADPDDHYCRKAVNPDGTSLMAVDIPFRTLCEADESPFDEDAQGVDTVRCLPSSCCDSIRHLCNVPLCPTVDVDTAGEGERLVRRSPTRIVETTADGRQVPDCIPYSMPADCCAE